MSLNFPDEPNDGDIFEGYVYNATRNVWDVKLPSDNNIEDLNNVSLTSLANGQALVYNTTSSNWVNQNQTFSGLTDTAFTTPTAGQKLVFDGTNWVNLTGYVYVNTVYFTSNGTFSKADYPWLRAIRVKAQAGGGGGGGNPSTTSTQLAISNGGRGGVYAESFITDIAGLAASVTVTRGAGGAAGAAGANFGANGGASSFGAIVSANGGGGGGPGAAQVPSFPGAFRAGDQEAPVFTGVGDLVIPGGLAAVPFYAGIFGGFYTSASGGDSFLGTGGQASQASGNPGVGFGSGASGATSAQSSAAKAGTAGNNGIVIVELYA